ncbi:MAG: hypothetical protein M1833_005172 [Piccolia ochrophora]|nr:MAG: hypothetical protein M1833_005172 [Piccolia ochrophora]
MDSPYRTHVNNGDNEPSNPLATTQEDFGSYYPQLQVSPYPPEWAYNSSYERPSGLGSTYPQAVGEYPQGVLQQQTTSHPSLSGFQGRAENIDPQFSQPSHSPQNVGSQFSRPSHFSHLEPQAFPLSYDQSFPHKNINPLNAYGTDPSLDTRAYNIPAYPTVTNQFSQNATVAPHALQNGSILDDDGLGADSNSKLSANETSVPASMPASTAPNASAIATSIPHLPEGKELGEFVLNDSVTVRNSVGATPLPGANHVYLGTNQFDISSTKSTVPKYTPRKSRHELERFLSASEGAPQGTIKKRKGRKLKVTTPKIRRPRPSVRSSAAPNTPLATAISSTEPSSESESEDESDYESSSDDEMDADEPFPLPSVRPTDATEGIRYDIAKAVWRPSRLGVFGDDIKQALADYWAIVKVIRDEWNTVEKDEAEKKSDAEVIKSRMSRVRKSMSTAIAAALQMGHASIIESMAMNPAFVSVLCKVLRDRIVQDDVNGVFTVQTLELLSRCTTLTDTLLNQLKFPKIATRLTKKGNERIKELVKSVNESTAKEMQRAEERKTVKAPVSTEQGVKPLEKGAVIGSLSSLTGIKRPRPDDGHISGQPQKKPASAASATQETSAMSKKPGILEKRSGVSSLGSRARATPSTGAAKPKTTHLSAKPTSFFSDLQSASKAKPVAKPGPKFPETQSTRSEQKANVPTMAPKPAFSIIQTIDEYKRPKEPEKVPEPTSKGPPETAEEREKRLRKEQRRKLRVHFKPDDALVEVKYFTHDQLEEVGRADNLLRDAGDAMEEGRMFKQHMEMDVMEDDEDGPQAEEALRAFEPLTLLDLSDIPQEERQKNYSKYGGFVEIESPDRKEQEQRESNTLMVIYTDVSDIPPSPKEPPYEHVQADQQLLPYGNAAPQGSQPTTVPNLANIFSALAAHPGQSQPASGPLYGAVNQQQAQQNPVTPASTSELERIFAMYATKPTQPPPQAPVQPTAGPNTQAPNIQNLLANLFPQSSQQSHQPHGQFQQQNQAPSTAPTLNLQAILAQLGQPATSSAQTQSQQNSAGQSGSSGNMNSSFGTEHQGYPGQNDGMTDYDVGSNGNPKPRGNQWGGNKSPWGGDYKPDNKWTLPCKFYKEGRCIKGDQCTYIHEQT